MEPRKSFLHSLWHLLEFPQLTSLSQLCTKTLFQKPGGQYTGMQTTRYWFVESHLSCLSQRALKTKLEALKCTDTTTTEYTLRERFCQSARPPLATFSGRLEER